MIQSGKRHFVVEVDVANQRDVDALANFAKDFGILRLRHGHSDQLAARLFKLVNLRDRLFEEVRIRRGHGLNADRIVATDRDSTDVHDTRFVSPFSHSRGFGSQSFGVDFYGHSSSMVEDCRV